MNEQLHIIITGDSGKTHTFPCTRKALAIYAISAIVLVVILVTTSIFSISLFSRNHAISSQLTHLRSELDKNSCDLNQQLKDISAENSRLNQEISSLQFAREQELAAFKKEKEILMSTAVNELTERSEIIENIISNIGVKVKEQKQSKSQNSGGPFIEHQPEIHDTLLNKADTYMDTIRYIPLGRPVTGLITSRFGKRRDPVNNRKSFHEGIDFRGRHGEKIYATAAGVVTKAFKNGSYGNYIEINHRNGFTTAFGHMQKYVLKKGDMVKRGQLIGYVGSSGRSTGPHLHYEVLHNKKPVNPLKFMQVSKLITEPDTPIGKQ